MHAFIDPATHTHTLKIQKHTNLAFVIHTRHFVKKQTWTVGSQYVLFSAESEQQVMLPHLSLVR